MMRNKCPFSIHKIAAALALIGLSTHASATLVADGKLGLAGVDHAYTDSGLAGAAIAEGYQQGWSVNYLDKNGKSLGNGQIWFGTDAVTKHQFIYYELPLTYVDNTYGVNSSAGWGGTNGHTFSNLLGSDSMGGASVMQWQDANAGGATSTARVDYIANCTADAANCDSNAANNGAIGGATNYRSGGVGPHAAQGTVAGANGASSNWQQDDQSLTGSASSILQIATSLEWDMQNICANCTTDSSTSASWLREVGYEFEFKAGTFDPATFGQTLTVTNGQVAAPGMLFGDPHVSPPMGNTVTSFSPPCMIGSNGTCGAPEPGTTWLLGAALGGVGWYARRRNKKPRVDQPEEPVPT